MAALVRAMVGSARRRGALLGVKGEALAAATAHDLAVAIGPTLAGHRALHRRALRGPRRRSLPAAAASPLDAQVRILSGLWGVVGSG